MYDAQPAPYRHLEILFVLDAEGPTTAATIADAIELDRERTETVLSTLKHTVPGLLDHVNGTWRLKGAGEAVVGRLRESGFDTDAFMAQVRAYRRAGKDLGAMRDAAFDIAADV